MFVIPSIFSAVDKMSGPMNKIGHSFQSLADKAAAASGRMERSMKRVSDKAMDVSLKTGAAGLAITAPLMLANKVADEFETQMGNIGTIVDTAKESIKGMGDQLLDMAARMPVKINDLTESLYQVRSAGFGAADAMNIVEQSARLSVTGLSSTTDATKAVTSALVSFKSEHLTAAEVADVFFKTVQSGKTKMEAINESFGSSAATVNVAGVKFREFQAATAALTNTGQTAAEAQNKVAAAISALNKPTAEMTKIFHHLHAKTGKDLIARMGGLVPALQAVGQAGDKAGVNLNKAFGRKEAISAFSLLTGNLNGSFKDILKTMDGVNTMNQKYTDRLSESNNIEQMFKNSMQSLIITIGSGLSPLLDHLTQKLGPIIRNIRDWMEAHPKLTEAIFSSALAIGGLLLGISAISLFIGTITKATALWGVAQFELNGALYTCPILWIVGIIIALIAIVVIAYKRCEVFRNVVDGLWEAFKVIISPLFAVLQLIWDLAKVVWDKLQPALNAIARIFSAVLRPIIQIITGAISTLVNVFGRLWDYLKDSSVFRVFSNTIGKFVGGALTLFINTLEKAADLLDRVFPKQPKPLQIDPNAQSAAMMFIGRARPVGVMPIVPVPGADPGKPYIASGQTPSSDYPALNSTSGDNMQQLLLQMQKQQVDINVSAAPGTNAEVTKNTGGKLPKTTSTVGQR